jgi:S1-C subfamily serine protease
MRSAVALACALLTVSCQAEAEPGTANEPAATAPELVDSATLRELLGEAVRIEDDKIRADGMLIRLAFEPLIHASGPIELQLMQGQGYRLTGIADGSPLWLLGLRDGDVLTAVDGQPIVGREHELRSNYEARPSRAELTYLRGSEQRTIKLEIRSGSVWQSSAPDPLAEIRERQSRVVTTTGPSVPPDEILAGLRCVGDETDRRIGRCEFERKTLNKLLDSTDALARSARIVLAMKDGQPFGFKLYGIRPNSLPGALGLKNGDVIASVNDRPLTSLESAMESYSQLRDAKAIHVEIERRNEPRELEITIVEALSGPASVMPNLD